MLIVSGAGTFETERAILSLNEPSNQLLPGFLRVNLLERRQDSIEGLN